MEEMKEFVIHNWQLLASAVLFILATIIGIVRGKEKGVSILGYILGEIAQNLPSMISEAEEKGGTAEQKKVWVLNSVLNKASKALGRKLNEEETSYFISNVSEQIEKVLETPQKKQLQKLEVNKNVNKYRN